MRKLWLIGALAAVSACKKDGAGEAPTPPGGGGGASPQATAEADALWKLAPKSATTGGVITGAALVQLDRALAFVHGLAGKLPGGGDVALGLQEMRAQILGTATSYADAGIALDRGAAFFFGGTTDDPRDLVVVLPVGDRDKFVATHGGTRDGDVDRIKKATCKVVDDHYACAREADDLVLGGGDLGKQAGVDGVRGDAELVIPLPKPPPSIPFDPTGPVKVAIGIKRGEIIARAEIPAKLEAPLDALAKAKRSGIDVGRAAGFAVLPADVIDEIAPMGRAPQIARDLLSSIAGPVTAVIPAGVMDVDVRMPLSDAGPAKQFLEHCDQIARGPVTVTKNPDGSCTVGPIPQIGASATVWIDGKTVRAAKGKGSVDKGTGVTASPVAQELADYTMAYWVRGSMIGADFPGLPPEARVPLAAMGFLSELGMGARFSADGVSILMVARSIHANPDDVVAAVEKAIGEGADPAAIEAIAKAHPGTPFAEDVKAGRMGVMAMTTGVGVLAAVAIPAFLEYNKRGRGSEADLALNRLMKSAKTFYVMNAAYPVGDTGRVPAEPACATMTPNRTYPAGTDAFANNPLFRELEFSIDEEFRCQYQYVGTAKDFTATAYCDLDCDGMEMKVIARGTIDAGGTPLVDVTKEGTD